MSDLFTETTAPVTRNRKKNVYQLYDVNYCSVIVIIATLLLLLLMLLLLYYVVQTTSSRHGYNLHIYDNSF